MAPGGVSLLRTGDHARGQVSTYGAGDEEKRESKQSEEKLELFWDLDFGLIWVLLRLLDPKTRA